MNLGPFARVFSEVVCNGEKRRNDSDKMMPTGIQSMIEQKGLKNNIDGCFMLFGGSMI